MGLTVTLVFASALSQRATMKMLRKQRALWKAQSLIRASKDLTKLIILKKLIDAEMDGEPIDEIFEETAETRAIAVSRRASIEHCELVGAAKLVAAEAEQKSQDVELLVVGIDSQSVLKWIGCANQCRTVNVYKKVVDIHKHMRKLRARDGHSLGLGGSAPGRACQRGSRLACAVCNGKYAFDEPLCGARLCRMMRCDLVSRNDLAGAHQHMCSPLPQCAVWCEVVLDDAL